MNASGQQRPRLPPPHALPRLHGELGRGHGVEQTDDAAPSTTFVPSQPEAAPMTERPRARTPQETSHE